MQILISKIFLASFIGYMNADFKIKPFSIILPKTSAYVKFYDAEAKQTFRLEMMNYEKNMISEVKPLIV